MAMERWARVPVDVEVASEFRYEDPIIAPGTLVIGITQSGETADTLAAMRLAKQKGADVIALTNVPDSQVTREADEVIYTHAGMEMGVAATKTFVAQVTALYTFALRLACLKGDPQPHLHAELQTLSFQMERVIEHAHKGVLSGIASALADRSFFLYMGRQSGVPVALEGALKLKEISYIPTEAYPAGEMKHGPIALLSDRTPVIAVINDLEMMPKMLSNMAEVRARGVQVIAIASKGSEEQQKDIEEHCDYVFYLPLMDPLLTVPLAVIPLQLFAYHLARTRGLNVDQPRNLAKTVTVE